MSSSVPRVEEIVLDKKGTGEPVSIENYHQYYYSADLIMYLLKQK